MEEIYTVAWEKWRKLYKKVKSGNYTADDVRAKNRYRDYCKRMERMYCIITYLPNGYKIASGGAAYY